MPEDQQALPADLVQLQRAYEAAHTAVADYVALQEAAYAELHPWPTGTWDEDTAALRNAWTPEETAELQRLRDAREEARKALWAHPEHGDGWKRRDELKYAAGAAGWPEPKR